MVVLLRISVFLRIDIVLRLVPVCCFRIRLMRRPRVSMLS